MSLQDLTYNEVRIRQGSDFQQVPNFVVAHEALADGQFVYYGADGEYHLPDATHPATHFVKRAGVARNSIEEIHDLIGTVQTGEPVMAFTGQGTVNAPSLEMLLCIALGCTRRNGGERQAGGRSWEHGHREYHVQKEWQDIRSRNAFPL